MGGRSLRTVGWRSEGAGVSSLVSPPLMCPYFLVSGLCGGEGVVAIVNWFVSLCQLIVGRVGVESKVFFFLFVWLQGEGVYKTATPPIDKFHQFSKITEFFFVIV